MTCISFRSLTLLSAMAAMLFLGACSAKTPDQPQPTSETPIIAGEPAGSNAADTSFVTNMVASHEQAVHLSRLVADRSSDPEVTQLAADISSSRELEIRLMTALLVQWNADSPSLPAPDGPGAPETPAVGTIDDATVARMQALSGQDFDALWLQSMIGHGQGAIQIATAEVDNGHNVDAVALAKRIVEKQQAEITRMQQILEGHS